MSSARLKYVVLGIGRMGIRHAQNIAFRTPRAELVGVCDYRPATHEAARQLLPGIPIYDDFKRCLAQSGADAVVVASMTQFHAEHMTESLKAGKHVLVEKPISTDIDKSQEVVNQVKQYPHLKAMVGLVRRFDDSYVDAKRLVDAGQLGKVHMIKSVTNDLHDTQGFFVSYSKSSGGIWIDCGIHDIDLARWFLNATDTSSLPNPSQPVKRVYSLGQTVRHPELAQYGDVDNALCMVQFSNGSLLNFQVGRTMQNGHECNTEIIGTEGRLIVNGNPRRDRTEIRDKFGVRTLSTPSYWERFKDAFTNEVNVFTECVLDDKPVPIPAQDALEATKIATALTISYRKGVPVEFDERGQMLVP